MQSSRLEDVLTEGERLYIEQRRKRDPHSIDLHIIERLAGEVARLQEEVTKHEPCHLELADQRNRIKELEAEIERLRDTPSNNDTFYMRGHSDGMAQCQERIKELEAENERLKYQIHQQTEDNTPEVPEGCIDGSGSGS